MRLGAKIVMANMDMEKQMFKCLNKTFNGIPDMPLNIVDSIYKYGCYLDMFNDVCISYADEKIVTVILDGEIIYAGSKERAYDIFNLLSRGASQFHESAREERDRLISIVENFLAEKALLDEYDEVYHKVDLLLEYFNCNASPEEVIRELEK